MGVGNPLRGDDGVGPYIAEKLKHPDWLSLNCETCPENFTSVIKKHRPNYLVIVDAATMGLPVGEYRLLPREETDQMYVSTHSIPLSALISYLSDYADHIILIGIQPERIKDLTKLSEKARKSAHQLIKILIRRDFEKIKPLCPNSDK